MQTETFRPGTIGEDVIAYLESQHLEVARLNFVPIPADAEELRDVLAEFAHELEVEEAELHNAWGAIIITELQQDLKRIDVIIRWEDVLIENGNVVFDENGEVVLRRDENGNPIPRMNSQHIFIHRDSQYFAAPGA